jgi:hypothetical protein
MENHFRDNGRWFLTLIDGEKGLKHSPHKVGYERVHLLFTDSTYCGKYGKRRLARIRQN